MISIQLFALLATLMVSIGGHVHAFVAVVTTTTLGDRDSSGVTTTTTVRKMGMIDDLSLIFSDKGKKNRKAYEDRQRQEQEEAQRAILEARRNPNKKKEYLQKVDERRNKLDAERDVWSFQKDSSGADPLQTWRELRSSGKIKAGDDIARDPTSSRLGSAGLQDIRTDDKLPYIDQGYVDESADVFANLKNMFGGKKE
ncbi:unnamed protein product [Cylindrotheca closterium]|uniref:Clathrin light chain n=1 Tax=Cylindrotheca closterium TaxID=2856 RepID=A0AAD2G685_9STRA|nr:unnamed protein product [Cylindrotheca closterium]